MIAAVIDNSGLQAKLARVMGAARNPTAIMKAVGREAANQLKTHFRDKNRSEANRLGGPRQNFWDGVAKSVQSPVVDATGRAAMISITHPAYAQKLYGGTIRAKRGKFLTIPQTPEAYGRYPATFERETGQQLFFVKTARAGVLARRIENAGLQVEYLLTPSVNQEADPTAFPDEAELASALATRADAALQRQLEREPQT